MRSFHDVDRALLAPQYVKKTRNYSAYYPGKDVGY